MFPTSASLNFIPYLQINLTPPPPDMSRGIWNFIHPWETSDLDDVVFVEGVGEDDEHDAQYQNQTELEENNQIPSLLFKKDN